MAADAQADPSGSETGRDTGSEVGLEGGVDQGMVGGVPGGVTGGAIGGTGTVPVIERHYDRPARPIHMTRPVYPQEAFVKKVEGTVIVEIVIDAEGRVARARVVGSVPLLDQAALETVRQWRFAPAFKGGRPVATWARRRSPSASIELPVNLLRRCGVTGSHERPHLCRPAARQGARVHGRGRPDARAGIGGNTAMFSAVNGVLLRSLPYDEPGRLVHVWEAGRPGQRNSVSAGVFTDWSRQATAFEGLAAFAGIDLNLTGGGAPERVSGLRMSPGGLALLRARPVLGRTFAPDEGEPGKDKVVVLTHAFWRRRFGSAPDVVGRTVRFNGESYTVVGVLAGGFLPSREPEFVVPLRFEPAQTEQRTNHWLSVVGRLKPGMDLARARADLLAVSDRFRPLYPAWKQDWTLTVVPMHEQITGDIRPILLVLLGAVSLVLLIACANVANLLLARAWVRQREIAIRLAVGASRARVIRQLLAESVVLALAGAAVGLVFAFAATSALRDASSASLPRAQEIAVDGRVLAFTVFVSITTGIVFGLVPALQASRTDLTASLKDGGGRGSTPARSRTRGALVVSEVALALVLLTGAGLLVNSFVRLLNVPPGFDPRGALAVQMSLPVEKYAERERRAAFTEDVLARIEALPGVEAAGAIVRLPLANRPTDTLITIPGRRGPADGAYPCDFDFTNAGFFRAMRIPLVRGRLFDAPDASAHVAIVNEAFVRMHFPDGDAVGKGFGEGGATWQIVGVVGDVHMRGLAAPVRPMMYRPLAIAPFPERTVVVRTSAPPRALIEPIRQAILDVDPEQPVANARTLEEVVAALGGAAPARAGGARPVRRGCAAPRGDRPLRRRRVRGLAADARDRRADGGGREPARRAGPLRRPGDAPGRGAASCWGPRAPPGSRGSSRASSTACEPTDPATFASVAALLSAATLAACWLPARRAARLDPMNALR